MKASNALNEPVKAIKTKAEKAKPRVAKQSSLFFFQDDRMPKHIEKREVKAII